MNRDSSGSVAMVIAQVLKVLEVNSPEGNDSMATSVGFLGLKASAIRWPLPKTSQINESSRGKDQNQAKPKTSSSSEQSY